MSTMTRSRGSAQILTFMIADIRGYTSFTQRHGDEAAGDLAGRFARVAREGIEAHGGELLELRGDEALAVFSSARASLRCAADLQGVFADETALHPDRPLTVGIGVDAGEAVAVEGGYRGGALNLAARLCSFARAGESLASEGVVHLARAVAGVEICDWGQAEAKGLTGAVHAYRVSSSLPAVPVTAGVPSELPPSLRTAVPMVDRELELRQLSWLWRAVRRGRGASVVVHGAAGGGKTRLLAALAEVVADGGGLCLYRSLVEATDISGMLSGVAGPALVVVDDVAAARGDSVEQLGAISAADQILIALAVDDEQADPTLLHALHQLAATQIRLTPLDMAQMRQVATLYLPAAAELIPADVLAATAGNPLRVHRAVNDWVGSDAIHRVGVLAEQASTDRRGLKAVESDLTGTVIDLQLVRERARLFGVTTARTMSDPQGEPYRGLTSFDVEDAAEFYGRERLVAEMVTRLAGGGLLGVVGPSGSGKSSVVRAGLVPALRSGVLPGSEDWTVVLLRPGEHPMRALDRAVLSTFPRELIVSLRDAGELLLAAAARMPLGRRVVVVIDQFEEVFTLCAGQTERSQFIESLLNAVTNPSVDICVVLTVRADFYGRCAEVPLLADLLSESHVLVAAMAREEYRRAVVNPAMRLGVSVDPALVDALVEDAMDEPGALPLVSTTMLELWDARAGGPLTFAGYVESGGVRGAVARLAERVYGEFSENQQALVRSIVVRLAGPGEGDSVVRRSVPLADFDLAADEQLAAVLDALAARRLLTVSDGAVEVAHEALLREWPRARDWLQEDRDGLRLRAHLELASQEWEQAGRDPAELYRGARLAAASDWASQHSRELNDVERDFVADSQAEARRELNRQRRTNRRLRVLLAGALILVVLASTAGVVALGQRRSARRSAAVALARELGAEAVSTPRIDEALLLARQAVLLNPSTQTESTLLSTELRAPALEGSFILPAGSRSEYPNLSADGRILAVYDAGGSGVERFYDAATRRPILHEVATEQIPPPLWVGRYFLTPQTLKGSNLTWSVLDSRHNLTQVSTLVTSPRHNSAPYGAQGHAFAGRDGRTLYYLWNELTQGGADSSSYLDRFDVRTGESQEVRLPAIGSVDGAQTGPRQLTVLTDDAVVTVDSASLRVERRLPHDFAQNTLGIVSPDGSSAVYRANDLSTVTLINLKTGALTASASNSSAAIEWVAFAPDDRRVVVTADDGVSVVYSVPTLHPLQRFAGSNVDVFGAAISRDGSTLFTPSVDGAVFEWDLSGSETFGKPFTIPVSDTSSALPWESPPLAVDPNVSRFAAGDLAGPVRVFSSTTGAQLATLGADTTTAVAWSAAGPIATASIGTVHLWQAAGTKFSSVRAFPLSPGTPYGASFTPRGDLLAVTTTIPQTVSNPNYDGWLDVFDLSANRRLYAAPLYDGGNAVAFSPDGRLLAVGTDYATLVFNPSTGKELQAISERATAAAFQDDNDLLTGNSEGLVQRWDPATGRQLGRAVQADSQAVSSITIAPGRFAVSGDSGGVNVWDDNTLQQIGTDLPGGSGYTGHAEYTADRQSIVVVYTDGSANVWPVSVDGLMNRACALAGRSLAADEWNRFVAGHPYQQTCP